MTPVIAHPNDGQAPPTVSVVVVSRNRSTELHRLFDALSQQTASTHVSWELVFVDNGSTDETSEVVRRLSEGVRFPVTSVVEPRPGKSYGLNAGVSQARGAIIAFTDDDGVPAPGWLEAIWRHFEQTSVACVGGRVELYDQADAEITVRLSRQPLTIDAQSFSPMNIPVIGCNLAIRACALATVGPFDTAIGPGSRVGVAEDVDLLYRLVRAGHRIGYDPEILVHHNHGRRTPEHVQKAVDGYLLGRGAFYYKFILLGDARARRWLYWEIRDMFAGFAQSGAARLIERLRRARILMTGALRYAIACPWPRGCANSADSAALSASSLYE